ncbi:MAG: DUF1549 domain-containing protein, partial [Verrucomicrobiales bacterium]|nr:DUF1549 domain-containing protein [Verrucomicrobiales bacterium]
MNPRLETWIGLATIACATASAAPAGPADGSIDFNRDIRPLFAKHCTACHGGVKAAGKISFVYRDKALAEGKSGKPAVVPGHPETSELLRRVTSSDPDERMPQPDHGPALNADEIETLRRWIRAGAPWSEHWSFVPPSDPPAPPVSAPDWCRVPADRFVLARLEEEGLKPSPDATPAEWLRRVTLDLTGLPPNPADLTAFEKDLADEPRRARERVVDRLLASPRFGERWASVWLDLARY